MSYFVIKCGGSVMDSLHPSFYQNIVGMLKQNMKPIIVHGGGPGISSMLNKLKIETSFVDGMRVTTDDVLDVVEMILSGSMNKMIVRKLLEYGGDSIGISGVDGKLLQAGPAGSIEKLGYVGKVCKVNRKMVENFLDNDVIPVVSPVAIDDGGQRWNVNADLAAAAIAKEFKAPLCLVTNVPGILKNEQVLPEVSTREIEQLIEDQVITGGMIPKVNAVRECLKEGINKVVILDGTEKNALKRLLNGEKIGTSVYFEPSFSKVL